MISPARRAAFEVLRRVFEEEAWADRALPAALRRNDVGERERAMAQRLAYGAVQRRGTSDFLIGTFAERRDRIGRCARAIVDEIERRAAGAVEELPQRPAIRGHQQDRRGAGPAGGTR